MADEPNQPQQGTQGTAEPTGDATPAPNPQNPPQDAQGAAGLPAGDAERDQHPANAEAAKYRRALRSAEARLEQYDRQTVERLATGRLAAPADAWLVIGSLDELRGDDGVLDVAKVKDGLERIVQERPHWAAAAPAPDLHQGARQEVAAQPSFGAVLKGGGRQ